MIFSLNCSNKTANNPTNSTTPQEAQTNIKREFVVKNTGSKLPSNQPALDGKTAKALYDYLKDKGWKLNEAKPTEIPIFDSEETLGFAREDRVGFVILRYNSLDEAQSKFSTIDRIYRDKFGRAITAKNFIIATVGGQKRINQPDFNQLNEREYAQLQQNLVDFCNL
jgi:hypothetical protein